MILNKIRNNPEFKNNNIILTEHSLGGSIAQYLAAKYNLKAATFNAYGVGEILQKEAINLNKEMTIFPNGIINYCHKNDPVSQINFKYQVGSCYKVSGKISGDTTLQRFMTNSIDNSTGSHFLAAMDKLNTREPYVNQTPRDKVFCTSAQEKQILKPIQEKTSDILHRSKSNCRGIYTVEGYTRRDGTQVKTHQRKCKFHQ